MITRYFLVQHELTGRAEREEWIFLTSKMFSLLLQPLIYVFRVEVQTGKNFGKL